MHRDGDEAATRRMAQVNVTAALPHRREAASVQGREQVFARYPWQAFAHAGIIPGSPGRFISEIRVAADDPRIAYARTGSKRGHHTMWAEPDVLLACVVRTAPV